MPTSSLSIYYRFSTTPSPMDWFSWLSRTNLEPSLIYEYSLAFARNELQLEDAIYFNHEFLQSMGISIAKHRLEILKLAKKEDEAVLRPKKLSGVIKKCLRKCMSKLAFREEEVKDMPTEPNWHRGKWRGALVRKHGNEELKVAKATHRSRTIALSGPLDGRTHGKMVASKALQLSGPLDGNINERIMYSNRSPLFTRPVDGRFMSLAAKSPISSGPLHARVMHNDRSPRLSRRSDERAEPESPMDYSPYNKAKVDSDYDDDYTRWPTLFEDLKPT